MYVYTPIQINLSQVLNISDGYKLILIKYKLFGTVFERDSFIFLSFSILSILMQAFLMSYLSIFFYFNINFILRFMKVRCSGYDYEKKINLFEKKIQLIPLTFFGSPTYLHYSFNHPKKYWTAYIYTFKKKIKIFMESKKKC